MATSTTNYGFSKPETNDYADITAVGNTIDQIDAALKEVEDAANDKAAINAHIADKGNPHGVTAEQVGAVKTDLSNFNAKLSPVCYIKDDTAETIYRLGIDTGGLYVVEA